MDHQTEPTEAIAHTEAVQPLPNMHRINRLMMLIDNNIGICTVVGAIAVIGMPFLLGKNDIIADTFRGPSLPPTTETAIQYVQGLPGGWFAPKADTVQAPKPEQP